MRGYWSLRQLDGSPYLEALLQRDLKRRESQETTDPILEETMMFTSIVGVEMLTDITNTKKRVDQLSLESLEGVAKVNLNINKVDCQVGELDHQMELVEDIRGDYQQFLLVDQQHWAISKWEINTLKVWCDGLVVETRALN